MHKGIVYCTVQYNFITFEVRNALHSWCYGVIFIQFFDNYLIRLTAHIIVVGAEVFVIGSTIGQTVLVDLNRFADAHKEYGTLAINAWLNEHK